MGDASLPVAIALSALGFALVVFFVAENGAGFVGRLIAEQAKVHAALEKLEAKYSPLSEKIKTAQADTDPPPATTKEGTLPKPPEPPKLDPESEKQLQELRKELAELNKQERQNVDLGKQIEGDLKNAADQAANLKLLPAELAEQMRALEKSFQQLAVNPLQNLSAQIGQGADSKQPAPDVKDMHQLGDKVQKDLEALRSAIEAAAKARDKLRNSPDQATAAEASKAYHNLLPGFERFRTTVWLLA